MRLELASAGEPGRVSAGSAPGPGTIVGAHRFQRTAVVVWLIILTATCGRALVSPRAHSVYSIFADAGRNWVAGADLYTSADQQYRYSPLATLLFVPFSAMPEALGGGLWRLVNAAVLLGGLSWWMRDVLPASLTHTQRALLWLLIAPLAVGNLHNGQSNPLVLGLLLGGTAAVSRQRWTLAASGVALACLFKVYPLAVGLLLVVLYPRRFGVRFLAALALGLALPFLWQHQAYVVEQYAGWWRHLLHDDRQALPRVDQYRDVRLLLEVCGMSLTHGFFVALQMLVAGVIGVVCVQRAKLLGSGPTARRRVLASLLSLACVWMTVFGSATESATYLLLAPAAAWALLEACVGRSFWSMAAACAGYGLFLAAQMATWFPLGRVVHASGVQALAGLLSLVALLSIEVVQSAPRKRGKTQALAYAACAEEVRT
jgi:hypothetical protein